MHGRCHETLSLLLGATTVQVLDFVEKLVGELRAGLFYEQKRNQDGTFAYDAYGIIISETLAQSFGLEEQRHFYVGLQLKPTRDGGKVIVVTLHPPERDIHCVDGTVVAAEEQDR